MITAKDIDLHTDDRRITIEQARLCFKGCIPGWKLFAETNGFIWKDVVRHGLLASELLSTDDVLATRLVEFVYNLEDNKSNV